MKKVKKMGIGGLPAGSPDRTVPRGATGPTPKPMPPRGTPITRQPGLTPSPGAIGPTPKPMPPRLLQPVPTPSPGAIGPTPKPMPVTRKTGAPAPNYGTPNYGTTIMKKGGKVSSASKRADGIAKKGKTKGRMV